MEKLATSIRCFNMGGAVEYLFLPKSPSSSYFQPVIRIYFKPK